MIAKLGLLSSGAAEHWARLREPDEVPMPVVERPVEAVLADLAAALRQTDMYWPRPDDEDYVEIRALAWARCREYLPDWPDVPQVSDDRRRELIDAFLAEADLPVPAGAQPAAGGADVDVVRSLADLFCDYGEGYIAPGPLAWSPGPHRGHIALRGGHRDHRRDSENARLARRMEVSLRTPIRLGRFCMRRRLPWPEQVFRLLPRSVDPVAIVTRVRSLPVGLQR